MVELECNNFADSKLARDQEQWFIDDTLASNGGSEKNVADVGLEVGFH